MNNPPPSQNRPTLDDWLRQQPHSERSFDLSIVIPAYNEQWRLPSTLIDIIDYMDTSKLKYEVIVVDDGSNDATGETVRKFEKIRPFVRLLRIPKNSGKGNAVRTGVLNSYGKLVLFMDADGATQIREIERLLNAIELGADIAIGSRAIRSKETSVSTRFYRKYLGRIFNLAVNILVLPKIADTQCGFKMFRSDVARFLFERQQSDKFCFDVEILYIAQRAELWIEEVAINWTNVPGSKVNLVADSIQMLFDVIRCKFRHRALTPAAFKEFKAKNP